MWRSSASSQGNHGCLIAEDLEYQCGRRVRETILRRCSPFERRADVIRFLLPLWLKLCFRVEFL